MNFKEAIFKLIATPWTEWYEIDFVESIKGLWDRHKDQDEGVWREFLVKHYQAHRSQMKGVASNRFRHILSEIIGDMALEYMMEERPLHTKYAGKRVREA